MIKKLFIAFLIPVLAIIVVLLISYSYENWENPLIAAGTVGAAVAAIWAIIYIEIFKPYFDHPILIIKEPGFKPPFYRRAPEKDRVTGQQVAIGYYINILLINTGKRTAKNCQPILTAMWKLNQGNWQKEENWISVALRWGAGEDEYYEYGILKQREERNLIPNRPYYLSLGRVSTKKPGIFELMQVIILNAQDYEFGPGEYCFEVTVNGEDIDPPVKYFKVRWDGECTGNLNEVKERFFVTVHDNPPSNSGQ
jgi:hypothetical protein